MSKGKIIIVDGMDACGKSTLIKTLRRKVQTPRVISMHVTRPPENTGVLSIESWEREYYVSMLKTIDHFMQNDYTIFIDRFHLSSMVYGTKFRGSCPSRVKFVDEVLSTFWKNVYLICLVDFPKHILIRGDEDANEIAASENIQEQTNNFKETYGLFTQYFNESNIDKKFQVVLDNDFDYMEHEVLKFVGNLNQ